MFRSVEEILDDVETCIVPNWNVCWNDPANLGNQAFFQQPLGQSSPLLRTAVIQIDNTFFSISFGTTFVTMEDDGKDVVVVVATDLTRCRDPEECSDEDEKSTKGKVLLETAVASKRRGRKPKRPEPAFPVEPRIIQVRLTLALLILCFGKRWTSKVRLVRVILKSDANLFVAPHKQIVNKPRTYTNHSYRDFSNVPPEDGYTHPTNVEDMTFAMKVHAILSQRDYSQCIAWCDHGRAFKILVPVRLEQSKCLGKYFGHDRYSSFLRSLSNYGFKHITQGRDRNAYYHEVRLCCLHGSVARLL